MARRRRVRITLFALVASTLGLAALLAGTWLHLRRLSATVDDLRKEVSGLKRSSLRARQARGSLSSLLEYQLELPGRGEVFPAMAATRAPEYWPVATLRVTNTADRAVRQTVCAEIPGWSRRTEQTLVLSPRETRQLPIQPELLSRAYENDEIQGARLEVRVNGPDASLLFAEQRTLLIHAGSEIYWGPRFGNARVAARWVTPHEPAVLELVSQARRFVPRGRMAGYTPTGGLAVEQHVREQARAVFRALQRSGLSYVNSLFVMGEYVNDAQRIRLPRETLRLASANCMDLSVVFASAMENLGLQPFLVILPGHAFVGVRLAHDSEQVLYLDLTVLPNGGFESAIARAERFLRETLPSDVLKVDVAASRALGVYPLAEASPLRVAAAERVRQPALPRPHATRTLTAGLEPDRGAAD